MNSFKVIIFLCIGALGAAQLPILKNPELLNMKSSNLILTLNDPVGPIIQSIAGRQFSSQGEKAQALQQALQDATNQWQAPVLAALQPFGVKTQSYWITNQIFVKGANPAILRLLQTLGILREIAREIIYPILPIFNPTIGTPPNGPEWGVKRIGAEEVWKQTKGEGAVVGVIDTGARRSHVALKDNWVGSAQNGWLDPILGSPTPTDNNGHGTHCVGTICGNNGIGVAPAAKWMACRGCDNTGCPQSALLACGQFMACPTNAQGLNRNCSLAPKVVSNSWGGSGGSTWYNDVIAAWNALDIIPVFAIGNEGPGCGTAGSPGDQNGVIGVGATNINDTVSSFSSRGPRKAADGVIKPQIAAPGEDINSAYHLSDNGYQILSGTSMATPHTAGAIALLVSRNKALTLAQVEELLYPTTFKQLLVTGSSCGSNGEGKYPNDVAGNGRLDINAAFNKLTAS